VLAMLFTFALQMGLLILLWHGVVVGGGTSITNDTPELDRLWRQVGQVQRQVCWLNKVVVVNRTAAADGDVNCTGAWPKGPLCSAGTRTPPSMSYMEFRHCLDVLSSILPNASHLSEEKLKDRLEDEKYLSVQEQQQQELGWAGSCRQVLQQYYQFCLPSGPL
jgi:hypothetical protein